ncbi:hypothetical protein AB205_0095970 [Aquarana catesbeiana]|uniref:BLM n=1 Tax=Aquarana catesbeiana TaxID=8400 RepID=A0A2G9RER0_AQUCT|nr:hypothetical protein AB205_0095970 [Aquarana catesbeiana]
MGGAGNSGEGKERVVKGREQRMAALPQNNLQKQLEFFSAKVGGNKLSLQKSKPSVFTFKKKNTSDGSVVTSFIPANQHVPLKDKNVNVAQEQPSVKHLTAPSKSKETSKLNTFFTPVCAKPPEPSPPILPAKTVQQSSDGKRETNKPNKLFTPVHIKPPEPSPALLPTRPVQPGSDGKIETIGKVDSLPKKRGCNTSLSSTLSLEEWDDMNDFDTSVSPPKSQIRKLGKMPEKCSQKPNAISPKSQTLEETSSVNKESVKNCIEQRPGVVPDSCAENADACLLQRSPYTAVAGVVSPGVISRSFRKPSSETEKDNAAEHQPDQHTSSLAQSNTSPQLWSMMVEICDLVDRIPVSELQRLSCGKDLEKKRDMRKRLLSNSSGHKTSPSEGPALSPCPRMFSAKTDDSTHSSAPTSAGDSASHRWSGNVFKFKSFGSSDKKIQDSSLDGSTKFGSQTEQKALSFCPAVDATRRGSSNLQDSVFFGSEFNTPHNQKPVTSSTCARQSAPPPGIMDSEDLDFDIDNFDIEDFDDDVQCIDSPVAPSAGKAVPLSYPPIREASPVTKSSFGAPIREASPVTKSSFSAVKAPANTSQSFGTSDFVSVLFLDSFLKPPIDNPAHERFRGYNFPHSKEMMKIFHKKFGLHRFRTNQLEAINATLCGEDCFILMPTGKPFPVFTPCVGLEDRFTNMRR